MITHNHRQPNVQQTRESVGRGPNRQLRADMRAARCAVGHCVLSASMGSRTGSRVVEPGSVATYPYPSSPAATKVMQGNLVKVIAWYDNEWGFSNRMLDTVIAFHNA